MGFKGLCCRVVYMVSVGQCDRFPCNLLALPGASGGFSKARIINFAAWASENGINLDNATFKNLGKGLSFLAKLRNLNPFSFILQNGKLGSGTIPEGELRERFIRDSIFLNQNNT